MKSLSFVHIDHIMREGADRDHEGFLLVIFTLIVSLASFTVFTSSPPEPGSTLIIHRLSVTTWDILISLLFQGLASLKAAQLYHGHLSRIQTS